MLSTERQALRQTHHQEEVIKTIQSALNRRTHYSLRRKLLEIYGKRLCYYRQQYSASARNGADRRQQ